MGARRGRGGIRGWLRGAAPPDSSTQPAAHDEWAADEGVGGDGPRTVAAGGTGAMTVDETTGQASLDHVLRRAAAARDVQPDELG